ncbi:MAG: pilus assembly protein [Bryobacteraceae bacterium]|nr:pilus assembly protein [Bryobacteraceae bacterium]MDW8379485.1 TadE/TadG family type IV pilus assembly protein [Bryobacterales bacterium]
MKSRRGSILIETAMFTPVLLLLLFGLIELAKITYTYYALQKTLFTVARYLATQQGVNFCDDTDALVAEAKAFALTGSTDASAESYIRNLTADQIQVRIERFNAATGEIGECECSPTGCDIANGGQQPDYIVVSIPDGYPFVVRIPQIPTDPILLRPRVRVPASGI